MAKHIKKPKRPRPKRVPSWWIVHTRQYARDSCGRIIKGGDLPME